MGPCLTTTPTPSVGSCTGCAVPAGSKATVLYGAAGKFHARGGVTGSVACNNATFTDPIYGTAKACWR